MGIELIFEKQYGIGNISGWKINLMGERLLWNNIKISPGEEFFSVDSFDLRYFGAVGIFLNKEEAEFAIDEIERSLYYSSQNPAPSKLVKTMLERFSDENPNIANGLISLNLFEKLINLKTEGISYEVSLISEIQDARIASIEFKDNLSINEKKFVQALEAGG
ncbi:MAG: hypothetical protein FWC47_09110 [Oscillospiraceae bacterium]|nr:hypothetical protein [Oscillospiraceae bacterium]